jgi:hypothetical protein
MSCPDELTLDLWLANALPPDEAATVSAHVAACATCTAQQERWHAISASLQAALDLDQDERAYLAGLDLAATWRTRPAGTTDAPWGWLALVGVVAAFIAWAVAAQSFGLALAAASEVGLDTVLLTTALGLLLGVGQAVIELSTNPALGLAQPLLALLALALLFWPRITSAPHYLQGVHS